MTDLEFIKKDNEIIAYINAADKHLESLGYTEHGLRHSNYVAEIAGKVLRKLNFPEKICKLAEIAGFLHDIGNVIHREEHSKTGALIAHNILLKKGFPVKDVLEVTMAIGNHHEEEGTPISPVAAGLIIADKSDVHRSRVRKKYDLRNDIHDRVNYSATKSDVIIYPKRNKIRFDIDIDTRISPVFEYFEIFMSRMVIAQRAAKFLGQKFELIINKTKML